MHPFQSEIIMYIHTFEDREYTDSVVENGAVLKKSGKNKPGTPIVSHASPPLRNYTILFMHKRIPRN